MIPGNVDPRRPDKVQRYKAPPSNGSAPGEDLTPDYMNILGPESTTANAEPADKQVGETAVKSAEQSIQHQQSEESYPALVSAEEQVEGSVVITSNTTNVIPTSPQYGVAIIPTSMPNSDMPSETVTPSTETVTDTTAKAMEENKDIHSTPSRNDRFKVVKIASLEPFKRGRWKCMDYVDEAPPTTVQQTKVPPQSSGSMQMSSGVYMQTQSLPQQHIQQMLMQGFTSAAPFFQNMPSQMIPQTQFIYPPGTVPNMQQQTLPQQLVNSAGVPVNTLPQFINTTQPYFQPGMVPNSAGFTMPQNFQNLQYVPSNINLLQNQNSAFVPTSQNINPQLPSNFQQSQTYAGQPNVTQPSIAQPMVNGHAFPPQNEQQPNSLPTQAVKNAILNANIPQQMSQTQISQPQNVQSIPNNTQSQAVPIQAIPQNQQYNQQVPIAAYQQLQSNVSQVTSGNQPSRSQVPQSVNQNTSVNQMQPNVNATTGNSIPTNVNPISQPQNVIQNQQNVTVQSIDPNAANNVYTNPQFVASVNSLPGFESSDNQPSENVEINNAEASGDSSDDPAKTNPVVNAIDNKIEQAMDLVKSHLMYTVREEVEVLKERIAELMERIQQLETENNFLRSQIPKCNGNSNPPNPNQNGTHQDPPAQ